MTNFYKFSACENLNFSSRKRKRRQHVSVDHLDSPVVPQCGQARGGNVVEDTAVALGESWYVLSPR